MIHGRVMALISKFSPQIFETYFTKLQPHVFKDYRDFKALHDDGI